MSHTSSVETFVSEEGWQIVFDEEILTYYLNENYSKAFGLESEDKEAIALRDTLLWSIGRTINVSWDHFGLGIRFIFAPGLGFIVPVSDDTFSLMQLL